MSDEDPTWSYREAESGAVKGPFAFGRLSTLLAAGEISADTETRSGDYAPWRRFQDQPEFERARRKVDSREAACHPASDEANRRNPIMFWLYGLGVVAVGTFFYYVQLASRNGGDGFPLNWLFNPILHRLGIGGFSS